MRFRRWRPCAATRPCSSARTLLPKFFPMLTTAAGTITPARVLIIGAGVAGLQAIATARRLGAVVSGYDLRPAVKEQVQSLGARFVELPLEAKDAQDARGYAKAQDEAFYAQTARADGESDRRKRRGDHHGGRAGQESARAGDRADGLRNGARLGDRRSGGGARRELRTDALRRNDRRPRRHHHRANQSREHGARSTRASSTRAISPHSCCFW